MSDFDNSFDTVFKLFKDNTKPMCELMGCPELVDDFIVDVEINRQSFKSFYEAGQKSKQKEIDRLKAIIAEALAVYDRPMCDETALYQRDDDIYHILTEDKFV